MNRSASFIISQINACKTRKELTKLTFGYRQRAGELSIAGNANGAVAYGRAANLASRKSQELTP